MADMKLVVVGAGGRMGRSLIRAISEVPGAVLTGAVERPDSEFIGADAGELAGLAANGVAVSDDPLPVFAAADGVLDFTAPAASVEFAALAAQARLVHVIGTTGCSDEDEGNCRQGYDRADKRHIVYKNHSKAQRRQYRAPERPNVS